MCIYIFIYLYIDIYVYRVYIGLIFPYWVLRPSKCSVLSFGFGAGVSSVGFRGGGVTYTCRECFARVCPTKVEEQVFLIQKHINIPPVLGNYFLLACLCVCSTVIWIRMYV